MVQLRHLLIKKQMKLTSIQWANDTVNPHMGCAGCELFPSAAKFLTAIGNLLGELGIRINVRGLYSRLINEYYNRIACPQLGHRNALTTTNIWHLRNKFAAVISRLHGRPAGRRVLEVIEKTLVCYAAKLHLNRGANILEPLRKRNVGYAPTFEQLTRFPGRMQKAAQWEDLRECNDADKPWLKGLPRLIFVSDMGDSFSSKGQFDYIEKEMAAVSSENGQRHLWLWLSKRPHHMRSFSERIGGFPPNVCVMTTLTGPDTLQRVDELRKVNASSRGLSIEPLWERIPPESLDLTGINWVIVGGESGSRKAARPFEVAWAEELREHCRKHGVAFFLKQLGRNPVEKGKMLQLKNNHGGDWSEWPKRLRVREFPAYFRQYRG
ncbi:MAG: DUF5131 family protein [Alphaproteobacteria bacterium]|nr:MAG: DUF5131 family protein [Alphaproteobacteria bacterium]